MRRLVVISGKPKIFTASLAVIFLLTSIHLAATARIASLKREQEQLERAVITQPSAVSQDSLLKASQTASQAPANGAFADPRSTITLSARNATPAKPAASTVASSTSPSPGRQIVISIPDRQLAVIDHGQVLKTYPVAVGARGTPSPDGDFVIINHAKDPIYRGSDTEIPPGKDNPLGSRWMGLNLKGYGIHGTNVQSSVGKALSHGCFRMRKQDVEELYTLVQVGDTVIVRRERDAMIAKVFATPTTTQPAVTLAAAAPNSEIQVAAAAATAMVETTEQ
jgi:lipoprotein-anchoring transpeptidase ErfK/SrfK